MAQVQVQFIIGQFAVNHIIPEGDVEEVKKEFFAEYALRLEANDPWIIEDTIFRPSEVSMVRVFEPQETPVEAQEMANDASGK